MRNHLPRGPFALVASCAILSFAIPGSSAAQVFDFDNMVMLANEDPLGGGYNDVWGFVGTDGHEYVIQGTVSGTIWWDVDDPTAPVQVKFIPGPGSGWRDMFVIGNYAYAGTEGGGGIQIIDISDPTDPTLVNVYDATVDASHNIFGDVSRNLLFVVGGSMLTNGGLNILDATDPVNLVEIGVWDNKYIHDMSIEGTVAHVNLIGVDKFRMLDLTDPTSPSNFGTLYFDPVGSTHASWPAGDGQHVFIMQETTGGQLDKLDISNPSAITRVAVHNPAPQSSPHNVHVEGNRVYGAWYARGTRVLDLDLNELGYWDTYPDSDTGGVGPGNWGVYPHLPSGLIAANDRTYGLFLLQYEPDAATLDGTVSSAGSGFVELPTVELLDLSLEQRATSYKFAAFPGPAQLRFSAYGHVTQTVPVAAIADGTTTTNVVLDKLPSGSLSGTVTEEGTGIPLEDADIVVVGTPLAAVTDASGAFSFPDVPSGQYLLEIARYGYVVPTPRSVTVSTGQASVEDEQLAPAFEYEDFAAPTGWSVVSDAATTSGFWVFEEPTGTYTSGIPFQTETDHTLDPEEQCAVTGNLGGSIGNDDVDGGATRLFSPVYDLSGMTAPHAFFYRWYAVNNNVDEWQVHVTTDGGAGWTLLENSPDHEPFWKKVDIDLTAAAGGASAVQFRFTAEDPDPGQVVEAALDDFTIYDAGDGATPVRLPEKRFGLELSQNFPNPFPSRTRIDFAVPSREHVVISVFDVRGARVVTLADTPFDAGRHSVEWDGRTASGGQAAAGVYFYKLHTRNEIRTRKMIRVN